MPLRERRIGDAGRRLSHHPGDGINGVVVVCPDRSPRSQKYLDAYGTTSGLGILPSTFRRRGHPQPIMISRPPTHGPRPTDPHDRLDPMPSKSSSVPRRPDQRWLGMGTPVGTPKHPTPFFPVFRAMFRVLAGYFFTASLHSQRMLDLHRIANANLHRRVGHDANQADCCRSEIELRAPSSIVELADSNGF